MLSSTESRPAAPPGSAPRDRYPPATVLLNVYDVTEANGWLESLGFGLHHTGVEVYGMEFHYGGCVEDTGVGQNTPRLCHPHLFREQYVMGTTPLSEAAVDSVVTRMEENKDWEGRRYDMVRHNCNHFSDALLRELLPPRTPEERRAAAAASAGGGAQGPAPWDVRAGGVPLLLRWWLDTEGEGEGEGRAAPSLIPPHVQRIARSAVRFLPASIVDLISGCVSFDT